MMPKRSWFAVASVAVGVLVAGCGSSEDATDSATATLPESQALTSIAPEPPAPPPPVLNRRAGNGQIVQQNGLVGSGTLQIINGNSADFAVVVTNGDPAAPQATIYVHGNSEATLSGIAGTYFVYLKSGTDWDDATLGFTRDRNFQKFDDPFDAESAWEITLQPSIGGNASTSDVPAF